MVGVEKIMKLDVIYNEDCLGEKGMGILPDSSIALIITDPPYLTTKEAWDKKEVVNPQLSGELFRVLKSTGSLYVWCGIGEKSQSLIRWFPVFSKDFVFKDLITWKKQRGIGMRKGWLYTREELMWFVKDNKKFVWNKEEQYGDERYSKDWLKRLKPKCPFKRLTNVWTDIKEETLKGVCGSKNIPKKVIYHFAPKPLKAMRRVILAHTSPGDIVLDPFMGSGTTVVACKHLHRKYIGYEIEKRSCDVAQQRLEREEAL